MGNTGMPAAGDWRDDERAFTALVRRWQKPVARFLARVVIDDDRVQDLCQDVFLRVYMARQRYREGDTFSTWLFQIALNIARDEIRKKRRGGGPLQVSAAANAAALDADLEQKEIATTISHAVARLPPAQREVLALRHDQGMNFEQMARVLGTPASTLKSRFAVALNRLREQLAPLAKSLEET